MPFRISYALLDKFLKDQCTAEEKEQVLSWLIEPDNQQARQWMEAHWNKLQNCTFLSGPDMNKVSAGIYDRIQVPHKPVAARKPYAGIYKIAAVLIILLVATITIVWVNSGKHSKIVHRTAYGQIARLTLPDGSRVTLNGNSTITYPEQWQENEVREVCLEGEAFFSITHTASHQKFIVSATDGFRVEVLGTEFSVSRRKDKVRAVLNSGKILLHVQDGQKKSQVIMQPGDLIEVKGQSQKLVHKVVNPEVYSSWKARKLIFEDTPVMEIAHLIEDTYGLKVIISGKALAARKLTGEMSTENLDVFLENLSIALNIRIRQQGNSLILGEK